MRLAFEDPVSAPAQPQTGMAGGGLWLRCECGGRNYLIPADSIASIRRKDQWERSGGGADGLAGWLQTPQGHVPVHFLESLLGLNVTGPALLALEARTSGAAFALGVERLSRWGSAAALAPLPSINGMPSGCGVSAVAAVGEDLALCLEVDRLSPTLALNTPEAGLVQSQVTEGLSLPQTVAPEADISQPTGRLLVFSLPGKVKSSVQPVLGVNYLQVLSVAERLPFAQFPGAAGFISGLVWWRDRAVPLIDFVYVLGGSRRPYSGDTIVVARPSKSSSALAIAVGQQVRGGPVPECHSVPASLRWPTAFPCLRGEFEADGVRLLIPDLDAFVR